jgi:hypothetical protein
LKIVGHLFKDWILILHHLKVLALFDCTMQSLNQTAVEDCIKKAVPHISEHIIQKARRNDGFNDNPKAIHPVTKVITLALDSQTRYDIQKELIAASGLSAQDAIDQISFIRACMESLDEEMVKNIVGENDSEDVWVTLNDLCSRDGSIFLSTLDSMTGAELQACRKLVKYFSTD